MAILIRFLLFGIIIYVAYRVLVPKHPVALTLNCRGITKCRGLSNQAKEIIDDFARENLLEGESVTIQGYYATHGRLRWVFGKNVNPSVAQRFRNLMINQSEFKK